MSSEEDHRSYEVVSEDGTYRRNQKDLIVLPNSSTNDSNTGDSIDIDSRMTQPEPVRRSGRAVIAPDRLDPSWA